MPSTIWPTPFTTRPTLAELNDINAYLENLSPQDVLLWGLRHLPNLYQSTAFGITGLCTTHMLSTFPASAFPDPSNPQIPMIFVDTLYHFQETLDLKDEISKKYSVPVIVAKPEDCETAADFEAKHGERLWERDEPKYDFLVKADPARRLYEKLGIKSVLTGRRRSQGAARAQLNPFEIDETGTFKLNPLVSWSLQQVQAYLDENDVPRNKLLARGYKSVGDWHSTTKSEEGEGERDGRWRGREEKTECGLHEDYFELKVLAMKQKREEELRRRDEAQDKLEASFASFGVSEQPVEAST
ncbi:putative MET16-3`-phosphoadenylylsulfate reductase [Calocera cornea HHB12733]|uniref:Putative MET16-3`-phosphoadenylylsulfate reductase n=1 Tax=Calocera cornea HHB12733 TaxID=1353952 RepID=A0A165K9R5_9BASI|nr:putative MET16-3`-phosphoadenylylsulfate reductase [Calocera cornea HHB12733]